jgi:hypothetical protein
MKLSKRTLAVLKNFSTINQSILVKPGNTIDTISNVKDIYAKTELDETFEKEFAIYDLNEFLGVVSLFEDPEFEFGDDSVIISDDTASQKYYYADKAIITSAPDNGVTLPSVEVNKTLSKENLQRLVKAATINNAQDITFSEEGVVVHDKSVPTSNKFTIEQKEESTAKYSLSISVDKLKFLIDDYDISICAKGLAGFEGAGGVSYFVALQPQGTYNA